MKPIFRMNKFKSRAPLWLALVVAVTLLSGCQAKPPPLSPAAASFKHEIKTCLTSLSAGLMEPVAKKDVAAINAVLEKVESPAVKLCRLCPFQVGVLSPLGEALAIYPPRSGNGTKNYSNYDLITKAIHSKKIQQQKFFLQNGSELYIICAPLVRENKVIGLIVIAINSKEAEKRWGFQAKEFQGLDFNS
jgi:hypothetical protein